MQIRKRPAAGAGNLERQQSLHFCSEWIQGISAMVSGDYAAVVVSRDLAVSCHSSSLGGELHSPAPEAQAPV